MIPKSVQRFSEKIMLREQEWVGEENFMSRAGAHAAPASPSSRNALIEIRKISAAAVSIEAAAVAFRQPPFDRAVYESLISAA